MGTEEIVEIYYANNGRKIRSVVDRILVKFAWITDKDHYYSLANEVFVDVIRQYDNDQDFNGFLYSCLQNKIMTDITRTNRVKRKADKHSVSIDTPIGDDEGITIADTLMSDYDIDEEVFGNEKNERFSTYLNRLSNKQREIVYLLCAGYKPEEIRNILKITAKTYADNLNAIKAFENIHILL